MDTEALHDVELATRLKRLDVGTAECSPAFGYDAMYDRHAQRQASARRRQRATRSIAGVLVVAFVGASLWRIDSPKPPITTVDTTPVEESAGGETRIVRADTYYAVAALEDRIASVDDALSVARASSSRSDDVARLETTRTELMHSYAQVRYAEMVSTNY
jgi:hypothetical protein